MDAAAEEIRSDLAQFTAMTVADYVKHALESGEGMAVNLEESLRILEQERRKMEGIEQELPQCMNLLADVMVGLEKELEPWKGERFAREFGSSIPVKRRFEEAETRVNLERGGVEMKKWMRSAQLWVDNPGSSNQWSGENARIVINKGGGELNLPMKQSIFQCGGGGDGALAVSNDHRSSHVQHQKPRKARLCWSPELHRRFLSALHQLGGAQAATPNQIREAMKADGLSNVEIKSHLQQYRLQTKRRPTGSVSEKEPSAITGVESVAGEQLSGPSHPILSLSSSPSSSSM
ncbi:transcription factor HHO2-like [Zingiber officinale]|uniref:HTH myb-type domain-containing protein n=1 Tax=Zingiber officinale TaxID=94328 RepID=A0A8J5M072_ZINOF|nr:transcription factor HHO2-like [Zingiber officinale]KAG6538906.1 hypothetical protein ZIOFF_004058 [Zingiber officinale]